MSESGAHVLVFPYPAQGHMIPLLDITRHLATRGLTITILVTPKNLPLLNPLLAAHPDSITPLVLPFPPHPDIPAGVENTVDLPANAFRAMMRALSDLRSPIVDWFRNHPSPPVAIISDLFLGWTHHLACQLSIRRYVFSPTSALAFSFFEFLWSEMPKNPGNDDEMVGSTEIPNSPVYPWSQISPVYRSYVEGDPNSEFIRDSMIANWASHGLVLNTFDVLDKIHLGYLVKKLGHDRIWPIGPVLPPNDIGISERELTLGLEKSGVRFILSVKGATKGGDYGSIPQGFEDRVCGRGLVIKGWAPQVSILRHKAVCAFLMHCGWNSTLESIVAGIPMLAWPMSADNFLNATLLVDRLDVAVRVCETVLNSDDLVKVLGEIETDKWSERRARVVALSKAALDAISDDGGSSFKNLDELVR